MQYRVPFMLLYAILYVRIHLKIHFSVIPDLIGNPETAYLLDSCFRGNDTKGRNFYFEMDSSAICGIYFSRTHVLSLAASSMQGRLSTSPYVQRGEPDGQG